MRTRTAAAALTATLALAVLTAGCGETPTGAPSSDEPELTAEQVITQLADRVPSVSLAVVYNADTDPNDLLGRPGGYVSKANFADTRIPAAEVEFVEPNHPDRGGSVEVFADDEAAQRRVAYIQALAQGSGLFAEYHYRNGPVLLRLSQRLTPTQAAEYETALAETG